MRKPLFDHFRPLILALKINQKIMFFQSRFFDLFFFVFRIVSKMLVLGTPFKIERAQSSTTNQIYYVKRSKMSGALMDC